MDMDMSHTTMGNGGTMGMDMPMPTASPSPSSGASMSSMSMSSMSSMTMKMVFYNAHDTPLYSSAWTPAADGSYAGTCIFLIMLSIISRGLLALKAVLERHWLNAHLNRQYTSSPENGRIDGQGQDPDAKLASLVTAPGTPPSSAEKVARGSFPAPLPWRFSVDVPRALIILAFTGVSYLLMLAVMTMNVGYFCSVLVGAFLGELAVGRYIQWIDHAHAH